MTTTELCVLSEGFDDDAIPVAIFTSAALLERFRGLLRHADRELSSVEGVPVDPFAVEMSLNLKPFVVGLRQDQSVANVRAPNYTELTVNTDGGAYVGGFGYWKDNQEEWRREDLFVAVLWAMDETQAVEFARVRMADLCPVWPERIPVRLFVKPALVLTVEEGEDK